MDSIVELLKMLNNLSPLALAALLGVVIYMLVKNQRGQEAIATNHLHGLPEMADTLDRIEHLLVDMNSNVIYIRARINGKS